MTKEEKKIIDELEKKWYLENYRLKNLKSNVYQKIIRRSNKSKRWKWFWKITYNCMAF